MNNSMAARLVGCIAGAILGGGVGVYGRLFVMNFYDIPQMDALAGLCGALGAAGGAVGGALLGLRFALPVAAGIAGACVGCFAGLLGRVGYCYWHYSGYAPDFDYAAGWFGLAGALLGTVGGVWLGVWLYARFSAVR